MNSTPLGRVLGAACVACALGGGATTSAAAASSSSSSSSLALRLRLTERTGAGLCSRFVTGFTNFGTSTRVQARKKTMSLLISLSSKVARKSPSRMPFCPGRSAFLMVPRMPETVRMEAPSNLATSSWLLNMPVTKAVLRLMWLGVPTSFSFFTTLVEASSSRTTPVAEMRHPAVLSCSPWSARTPVLGGTIGPHSTARQCMCSGVYFSIRMRPLLSSMA
mmetsp:Transcript_26891/g.67727  ORF Transcript_26891/g.67727 Transcript_26891/m.67727 type:complete len:220 (+) Transcript_26891:814-1473(+)